MLSRLVLKKLTLEAEPPGRALFMSVDQESRENTAWYAAAFVPFVGLVLSSSLLQGFLD